VKHIQNATTGQFSTAET